MQLVQDAARALLASTNARADQLIKAAAAIDSLIAWINASGIETRPYKYTQAHFSASPIQFSLMYSQELARPDDTEKLLNACKHSSYRVSNYRIGDEFVNFRLPGLDESACLFIYNIDAASAQAFEAARQGALAGEAQL
ncbi:hypothetical protein [Chromobacterium subtsugae]|uniref:hypothetical protein n=1 Tax=Chromobacterium subtsugae TaxID=251747 RepID=UPI0006415962|nr:hypothetical protein [Chromobacterium subtsugae]